MIKFLRDLWDIIKFAFFNMDDSKEEVKEPVDLDVPHETPVTTVTPEPPKVDPNSLMVAPKLEWETPTKARHSARVVMDEYGLGWEEKNLLCAVIECESGFNIKAKNINKDGTGDYGICQMNDYWYIGKNRPITSIEEALNNPEKCVRVMIKRYKEGGLRDWVCYLRGMHKKYL